MEHCQRAAFEHAQACQPSPRMADDDVDLNLSVVAGAKARVFGPIGMEQLWNRGGATGGKRSALRQRENDLIWGETVATGCHQLPFGSHGKEGVDSSSPEEGFCEIPANEAVA